MPSKLVRDKIPDLMRAEGLAPVVAVDRSLGPLLAKLREEAAELEAAATGGYRNAVVEELADLCEAYDEILDRLGVRPIEVGCRRHAKREAKGGFAVGLILHQPDPPGPRRMAYHPEVAADVARLRDLLLEHGVVASDGDIALAFAALSNNEYAVRWTDLAYILKSPRYGPKYVVSELVKLIGEVPGAD